MTRISVFFCLLLMAVLGAMADKSGITVVNMNHDATDMTAAQRNLRDSTGTKCALLRVFIIDDNAVLTAPYVELEKKVNEYALWMPEGSTSVKVKTSVGDSLIVRFKNYGIDSLVGQNVYVLTLDSPATQLKKEGMTGMLKLTVTPRTSTVLIDGDKQTLRFGRLSAVLPAGTHTIGVTAPSGATTTREVQIGNEPVEMEINLNQTNPVGK